MNTKAINKLVSIRKTLVLFGGLVLIDQITKLVFSSRDFFFFGIKFHPVKNFGLVFSINFGLIGNILLVIAGLFFFIYYYFSKRKVLSNFSNFFLILIFAGAISNLFDRIYLGFVRDFIDVNLGFTFNLGDLFLVIGIIGVLVFGDKVEKFQKSL